MQVKLGTAREPIACGRTGLIAIDERWGSPETVMAQMPPYENEDGTLAAFSVEAGKMACLAWSPRDAQWFIVSAEC